MLTEPIAREEDKGQGGKAHLALNSCQMVLVESGEWMTGAYMQVLTLRRGRECAVQHGLCEFSAQVLSNNGLKLTHPFKLPHPVWLSVPEPEPVSPVSGMSVALSAPICMYQVTETR